MTCKEYVILSEVEESHESQYSPKCLTETYFIAFREIFRQGKMTFEEAVSINLSKY